MLRAGAGAARALQPLNATSAAAPAGGPVNSVDWLVSLGSILAANPAAYAAVAAFGLAVAYALFRAVWYLYLRYTSSMSRAEAAVLSRAMAQKARQARDAASGAPYANPLRGGGAADGAGAFAPAALTAKGVTAALEAGGIELHGARAAALADAEARKKAIYKSQWHLKRWLPRITKERDATEATAARDRAGSADDGSASPRSAGSRESPVASPATSFRLREVGGGGAALSHGAATRSLARGAPSSRDRTLSRSRSPPLNLLGPQLNHQIHYQLNHR